MNSFIILSSISGSSGHVLWPNAGGLRAKAREAGAMSESRDSNRGAGTLLRLNERLGTGSTSESLWRMDEPRGGAGGMSQLSLVEPRVDRPSDSRFDAATTAGLRARSLGGISEFFCSDTPIGNLWLGGLPARDGGPLDVASERTVSNAELNLCGGGLVAISELRDPSCGAGTSLECPGSEGSGVAAKRGDEGAGEGAGGTSSMILFWKCM